MLFCMFMLVGMFNANKNKRYEGYVITHNSIVSNPDLLHVFNNDFLTCKNINPIGI